jgi:2-polyprenyl-3-methyl-5-hydroxy-6-metoxy-1,4-benzoquinol methylase
MIDAQDRLPSCGACSSSVAADRIALRENGYDGYRCNDCGLIYVAPRPDPDAIANLYGHDSAHVSASELIAGSNSFGKALKARMTLRLVRSYMPHGELLEIGAGGGAFMRQAARSFRVHAAEFNPAQVEHMKSLGVDCRRGAFSEVFDGMKFDVIYHCDVLSHFTDPVGEFRAMRKMLNPGGVVVFETGNFGDVEPRHHHLVERWQYPDHLYFFSRHSLANLAAAAEFEIEEMREYSRAIEMRVGMLLKPARSAAKGSAASGGAARRSTLKGRLLGLAMNLKHAADFVMIYWLGAILPKGGRPQTVIVVLRAADPDARRR